VRAITVFLIAGLFLTLTHSPATGAEESGKKWTELPSIDELPTVEDLPNPFLFNDGSKVETRADWEKRREEIKDQMTYYQYGHFPPAPDNLVVEEATVEELYDGLATAKHLIFKLGPDHQVVFRGRLLIPKGEEPFPAIVHNTREVGKVPIEREVAERGYVLAEYVRTDLDPDENNQVGLAQAAYPDYDWATLAVWAWGSMRVLDYLETLDFIDADRVAVTGHSRGGKTALLAGAMDERFALVNPNGSGCGGAGCYRIMSEKSEDLDAITDPERFSYWFQPRFRDFADREEKLPFDQHSLKALVAPRLLLSTDGLGDRWANPLGTQATHVAAQPVFDFLEASENNAIHFREGGHEHGPADWRALLDFADKMFYDAEVDTEFNQLPFPEEPKHFSWQAP
jgi:hypothetical protein